MKGGQPALFVSAAPAAEHRGDIIAISFPTGDTAVQMALTRNAALCLMGALGAAIEAAYAPPKGLAVVFPTTARVAKVMEL